MRLIRNLWIIERWKNLVFFSHSLRHWTYDFCHHKISSFLCLSSSFLLSSLSSYYWVIVYPAWMNCPWRFSSFFSSIFLSWKMFPKTSLFHLRTCCLKCLIFCWKQYIFVPLCVFVVLHKWRDNSWKYGWESQIFSNLKGLSLGVAIVSTQTWTGQWSEPAFRSMLESTMGPSKRRVSKMRKRSSLHSIWWCPDLLLV